MINHIKPFVSYLFYYEKAVFESGFNMSESMSRISNLAKDNTDTIKGEIILSSDEIILYNTKHIVSVKGGTPMIPIFKGRFIEKNGKVILQGRFSIDSFCKLIIGVLFGAAALHIIQDLICGLWPGATSWLGHSTGPSWGIFLWLLMLIVLLEMGFFSGKKDIKYISAKIQNILSAKEG